MIGGIMRVALIIIAAISIAVVGLSVVGYYRVKAEQIDMNSELRQYRDFSQPPPDAFVSNDERRVARLGRLWVPVGILAGGSAVFAIAALVSAFRRRHAHVT